MSAAPVKILVIDGEAPIRRLLRMRFSTQGYEIIDASNGRVAIGLLAQKPDLITLDLNLPDIPGFELLKVIRMRAESIPIVVLSGRDDGASKVQAFDLGADDHVTKPFGIDEFFRQNTCCASSPTACAWRTFDFPRQRSLGRSCPAHRQSRAEGR